MEHWKKVDFLKLGFPCNNSTDTYLVSNEGRVKKINKKGRY